MTGLSTHNRTSSLLLAAVVATGLLASCSPFGDALSGPECEVTVAGIEYRSGRPQPEPDQPWDDAEVGQRYRSSSGCVPDDLSVAE